jgi:hypothetical protein
MAKRRKGPSFQAVERLVKLAVQLASLAEMIRKAF